MPKHFVEGGKKRAGWRPGAAGASDEVEDLRRESSALKDVVAELILESAELVSRNAKLERADVTLE